MGFFSQKAIYYFIDQFNNLLFILYIKTLAFLKHQRFDNNKNKETVQIAYKYQQFDKCNNDKRQNLNGYKDDSDSNRYIPFSSTTFLLFSQKELKCLSNLGKKIKSLIYFVHILKNL